MITEDFIRDRITDLRIKMDVTEHKMSLDLGHSGSYIRSISSGRALPSMAEFLVICEYLGVTPQHFFDEGEENPILIQKVLEKIKSLDDSDLETLLVIIDKFVQNK